MATSNTATETVAAPTGVNPTGKNVQSTANLDAIKFMEAPKFTDKEAERKYKLGRLAAAFRIFGKYGFDEGVAGHLTLRDPILKDHFWVNPFGKAFSLMTVSDLLLISPEGKIVAGGKPDRQFYNEAAFAIHHAVHTARPDVEAACHSHSVYGRAFSTLGKTIDMTTQDACTFYNDLALYDNFGGIVLAAEEGANVAKALGQKKAVILQNHGLLTCAESIDAATFWFICLDSLCHIQLLADAAAGGTGTKTIPVGDDEAAFTAKIAGTERAGWFQAQPYFDKIAAETKEDYLA